MDDSDQLLKRNIIDDQRIYMIGKDTKKRKKSIGDNQYTVDSSILGLIISM
ncbi:hypothetical protein [Methanosarcina barkeri]|uniref:hypothetical protein n=1 Tax=Methanosarcina barkeri TaxID=2208 RepID=UPI0012D3DA0C|nr:hypothetical protein [Methanosarcina barkeri]